MKITKQKGTKDIFFSDMDVCQYVESNIRNLCKVYNLDEIRTPVFEATELYTRGVGDETDIVNKEMYTFLDKGNRSITLRPELTAGVVRAYIENGFSSYTSPVKLWYKANMYRYEKMQKGRYREFSQFGVEIFGTDSCMADIETILISYDLMKRLKLDDKVDLTINSIGCIKCRNEYIEKFKEYLKPNLNDMCDTCKTRFEKNTLRILDCKEERCRKFLIDAPMITDNLCDECSNDFENLKNGLNDLEIPYTVDKKIVRGLDYYNKTVYEYISKDLGLAVGGGGRYDTLVESLGGSKTAAVGFGIGVDRLELLIKEYNNTQDFVKKVDIYFALIDDLAYKVASKVILSLRNKGFVVDSDICKKSFKAQMKYADKQNAKFVCIIGESEINSSKCIIKNMDTSEQIEINFEEEEILKIINN